MAHVGVQILAHLHLPHHALQLRPAISEHRVQALVSRSRAQCFFQRLHALPSAAFPANQAAQLVLHSQLLVCLRQHLLRDMTDVLGGFRRAI